MVVALIALILNNTIKTILKIIFTVFKKEDGQNFTVDNTEIYVGNFYR